MAKTLWSFDRSECNRVNWHAYFSRNMYFKNLTIKYIPSIYIYAYILLIKSKKVLGFTALSRILEVVEKPECLEPVIIIAFTKVDKQAFFSSGSGT